MSATSDFLDEVVGVATEAGNIGAATAGFLLTAFGVIGAGGTLLPLLLLLSSLLLIPMKVSHIERLDERKTALPDSTTKQMYTALRNKESGTALALGATTLVAGALTIHSADSAAAAIGVLHPALSVIALGFAINALVESYDNFCQWRERVSAEPCVEDEKDEGALRDKQVVAARNLALSSFVKLLGWSCVVTGGFALAAPFAPCLIPGGLALVLSSHLYNNFFAIPRVEKSDNHEDFYSDARGCHDAFISSIYLNSCRGGRYLKEEPNKPHNKWLQLF
jgi:hypothetical protein